MIYCEHCGDRTRVVDSRPIEWVVEDVSYDVVRRRRVPTCACPDNDEGGEWHVEILERDFENLTHSEET